MNPKQRKDIEILRNSLDSETLEGRRAQEAIRDCLREIDRLEKELAGHSGGSNGYVAQLLALCKTLAAGVRADEHCGSDDLMPQPPCSWEHAERNAMCPTCHRCWQCGHADNCERGIAKRAAEEAGL